MSRSSIPHSQIGVCNPSCPFPVSTVNSAVAATSTSTTPRPSPKAARLDTPIFVCQLSFPGMPTLLHIFEPRYRLMLRRVLQQPVPEFGMVMYPSSESHTVSYGTMLRVRTAKILSDGRSVIDTWGTHRFRILERGEQDGYIVGTVETIQDLSAEMEREIERNATLPIPPRTPPFVPISPPKSSPTLMALSPPPNRSVPPLAALHPLPPHIPSIRPTGTTMHHPHPPRTLSPSPSIASISTIGSTSSSA
ncbi:hypothetical protein FRB91_003929, partial [Serendipita sp. 411]